MAMNLHSCKEEFAEKTILIKIEPPDVKECCYSEEKAEQQDQIEPKDETTNLIELDIALDVHGCKEEFTENTFLIKSEPPDVEECCYSEGKAVPQVPSINVGETAALSIPNKARGKVTNSKIMIEDIDLKGEFNNFTEQHCDSHVLSWNHELYTRPKTLMFELEPRINLPKVPCSNINKTSLSVAHVPCDQVTYSEIKIEDLDLKKEFKSYNLSNEDVSNCKNNTRPRTLIFELKPQIKLHKTTFFERNFVCGICYKAFPSFHDQYTHKVGHTQIADRNIHSIDLKSKKVISVGQFYACDKCRYTCKRSNNIKRHKMTHSGLKPFKCEKCNYASTNSSNLKVHERTHSSVKMYNCDKCSYTCKYWNSINVHKMIHSGLKSFKCDKCEYTCVSSSYLNGHKKIHSSQKPYKCNKCISTYKYSQSLKNHMMIHTGEKPFKCEECNFATTTLGNLRSHRLRHS